MKNTAILGRILICYNHFNRNKYERKQKYGEKETGLWTETKRQRKAGQRLKLSLTKKKQ